MSALRQASARLSKLWILFLNHFKINIYVNIKSRICNTSILGEHSLQCREPMYHTYQIIGNYLSKKRHAHGYCPAFYIITTHLLKSHCLAVFRLCCIHAVEVALLCFANWRVFDNSISVALYKTFCRPNSSSTEHLRSCATFLYYMVSQKTRHHSCR